METRGLANNRMVPLDFWTDDAISKMSYPTILGLTALNFMKAVLTIDCSAMTGRYDYANAKVSIVSKAKVRRSAESSDFAGGGDEDDDTFYKPYPFGDDDINPVSMFCNITDFVATDYAEIGDTLFPKTKYLTSSPRDGTWPLSGVYVTTRPFDDGRMSHREHKERYRVIDGLRKKSLVDTIPRGFSARWFISLPVCLGDVCVWVHFICDTGSAKTFINTDVAESLGADVDETHRIGKDPVKVHINGVEQGHDDVLVSNTDGREKDQNILSVTRFLANAKANMVFDHTQTKMYSMDGKGVCTLDKPA